MRTLLRKSHFSESCPSYQVVSCWGRCQAFGSGDEKIVSRGPGLGGSNCNRPVGRICSDCHCQATASMLHESHGCASRRCCPQASINDRACHWKAMDAWFALGCDTGLALVFGHEVYSLTHEMRGCRRHGMVDSVRTMVPRIHAQPDPCALYFRRVSRAGFNTPK
jgi:hypothetical protein